MMQQSESSNSDYNRSPTRPTATVIPVRKSSYHAVTSIKGNTPTKYINITEQLINFVFEHAKNCKDADHELESILRTSRGIEK